MDEIVIHLRGENEPPAAAPVDGELSQEQYDATVSNLKTGIEQVYAETVHTEDMVDVDPENPDHLTTTLMPVSLFFVSNPDYDEEDPDSRAFLGITWESLQALLPDGGSMSAEDIRDALETLEDDECLTAHKLSDLGDASVAALEARVGASRLSASAIKDLPAPDAPGAIATISHDGAGDDPVVGDTLTISLAAGWGGPIQWTRDGVEISGATGTTYDPVEDDEDAVVGAIVGDPDGLHSVIAGLYVAPPAATVPAQPSDGDWDTDAGVEEYDLIIDDVPDDGGSAITSLQARENGGAPFSLSGVGAGVRTLTGKTGGVLLAVEWRANNAVGSGPWSEPKNVTPTAAGGTVSIVNSGTSEPGGGGGLTRTASVPSGALAGHRIVVILKAAEAVTSVTDNQGNVYTSLKPDEAEEEDAVYVSAPLGATVPTTITMEFAGALWLEKVDVFVVAGASGTRTGSGTISTGSGPDPRSHAYATGAANDLAFGVISFTGGGVTGVTGADGDHTWLLRTGGGYQNTFGIVRPSAGSYGATLGPTGASSGSTGYWFRLGAA